MTHGDLIPGNVLVAGPRRDRLRALVGCSDLEWERGRGWAFVQAMGWVHYYATTNPGMHALGLRTIREVLGDDPPAPSGQSGGLRR